MFLRPCNFYIAGAFVALGSATDIWHIHTLDDPGVDPVPVNLFSIA